MPEKKQVAISKDKLADLIIILENDLPKLQYEESFQYHEPSYYNYVTYYEELVETLLSLGGKDSLNLFGAYLVGLLAYQVMDLKTPLYMAVQMIVDELKNKINWFEGTTTKKPAETEKKEDNKKFDA